LKLKKSRGICTANQLASKFPISHYYRILGVKAETKPEDIKKAYFDKSKRYHPDLYPDDKVKHQKFYEINEAYEIVIKTSKESSKEVRAGLNKKLGKTFGQGKFRSWEASKAEKKDVKVQTPLGFGRGTAKKSFQTGTFRGQKDQYAQEILNKHTSHLKKK